MFACRLFAGVLFCAALLAIAGCGGTTSACTVAGVNVTPSSATADHTAAPPGNGQDFNASDIFTGSGCPAITAAMVNSNWTVSDPSVHLSATQAPQVTATCTATVANPVTIKATAASDASLTGQAMLVCK